MLKTNFANNNNGKLLCNEFVTVRLHDGRHELGQARFLYLNNEYIGEGIVSSSLPFGLKEIPDIIALMDCGRNGRYLGHNAATVL